MGNFLKEMWAILIILIIGSFFMTLSIIKIIETYE